jgi:PBP1b-binding outer membrane lipoprotein LpoB
MNMKKQYIYLVLTALVFTGCKKLEQVPESTTSRSAVFGSEKGMELYANSFYNILPTANNIHTADNMSDYAARRDAGLGFTAQRELFYRQQQ